jgi:hypothetical protein
MLTDKSFLRWVREDHNFTHRIASHIGMSHMQVLQTLHEEVLRLYHRVQHHEQGDRAQYMDLCH